MAKVCHLHPPLEAEHFSEEGPELVGAGEFGGAGAVDLIYEVGVDLLMDILLIIPNLIAFIGFVLNVVMTPEGVIVVKISPFFIVAR